MATPRLNGAPQCASLLRLMAMAVLVIACASSEDRVELLRHRERHSAIYEDSAVALSVQSLTWWDWIKHIFHIRKGSENDNPDATLGYSEATAVYLARVTSVAYCGANHIRNWSCSPCALVDPLEDIHVVEDKKDKFQGLVGFNKARNEVLVAFRGSMDITNWIDNLTFIKKRAYTQFPDVKVHQGFYWVFKSVGDQVVAAVRQLLSAHPAASVVVTGHSLGGAVAALCSFQLALIEKIPVSAVYTFGEPRVGNKNFSSLISQAIPQVYRVTHFRDVVPHLPPSWIGYQHGAQEIYYDEFASTYRKCDPNDGEDPSCSNECSPFGCTSVVDHLTYVNVTMSHLIC